MFKSRVILLVIPGEAKNLTCRPEQSEESDLLY